MQSTPAAGGRGGSGRASKTASQDVGTALRNAFRATVEEEVPPEMLDLLRRLD